MVRRGNSAQTWLLLKPSLQWGPVCWRWGSIMQAVPPETRALTVSDRVGVVPGLT